MCDRANACLLHTLRLIGQTHMYAHAFMSIQRLDGDSMENDANQKLNVNGENVLVHSI